VSEEEVTLALTAAIVVEWILSVAATGYIALLYLRTRTGGLFRDVLALVIAIEVGGAMLLAPAIVAVFGLPRVPYTGPLVALAVMVLLAPPIVIALRLWWIRRAARRIAPHHDEDEKEHHP
jgi:hypothetical protein